MTFNIKNLSVTQKNVTLSMTALNTERRYAADHILIVIPQCRRYYKKNHQEINSLKTIITLLANIPFR
jgi:hypothetical protein